MSEQEEQLDVQIIALEEKSHEVEKSSKDVLLSVHENMDALVQKATDLEINPFDEDHYNYAVELKREIKATHVAIEKKRKEVKAPFIQMGRNIDAFASSIYEPLKEAEKIVKEKMEVFEAEKKKQKEEQKKREEQEKAQKDLVDKNLLELHGVLAKINACATQQEVGQIEKELDEVDLKTFGDRSDEAGFILTNLKSTCAIAKKALPEIEEPVANPVSKVVELIDPITEETTVLNVKEDVEEKEEKPEPKKEVVEDQSELDFGAIADNQASKNFDEKPQIEDDQEKHPFDYGYHSFDGVPRYLANDMKFYFREDFAKHVDDCAVIPLWVGKSEEQISEIHTITSISQEGSPKKITGLEMKVLHSSGKVETLIMEVVQRSEIDLNK